MGLLGEDAQSWFGPALHRRHFEPQGARKVSSYMGTGWLLNLLSKGTLHGTFEGKWVPSWKCAAWGSGILASQTVSCLI